MASGQRSCADGLARARQAGDLHSHAQYLAMMCDLDRQTGHTAEAGAHLREALELATRISDRLRLIDCLQRCGDLCAVTHRWAEAITVWAAHDAHLRDTGLLGLPTDAVRRQEPLRKAAQALGPGRMRAAENAARP